MLGFGFMYHGFPKLFSAEGRAGFVGMLDGIGIPAPGLMAWVVGIVEFGGGLALVLGAFTAIAGLLLIIDMLVAALTVHPVFNFMNIVGMTEDGPVFGMPGYEVPLLYAAAILALVLGGPGPWSVDEMRAAGGSSRQPERPAPAA